MGSYPLKADCDSEATDLQSLQNSAIKRGLRQFQECEVVRCIRYCSGLQVRSLTDSEAASLDST